jgi:thiol reductant ABC exporter CydD subunit
VRPLDPRLLREARSARGYIAVGTGLGVLSAVAVIAQAVLLAHLIAAAFVHGADLAALRGSLVLLLAVIGVRALLAWAQEAVASRSAARVKQQLRARLLRHILDLGPGWLAGNRSGDLTALTTRGIDALDPYVARYLPQLVLTCIVPPMVIAAMGFADVLSAVIVLVTLPVIPVFMVLVGWTTRARTERQWSALQRLSHHFLDVLDGMPVLRVYDRGKAQATAVRKVTDDYRRTTLSVLRVSFLSSFVLELAATLSVALVAVSVGLRLLGGSVGLQTALLVLILAPEAYLPLRQMGSGYHAAAEGVTTAKRVLDVLDEPLPDRGDLRAPVVAELGLDVTDLQIRYPDRPRAALAGATLRVAPGELVAVIGPSGVGKSSLLAAVLGFTTPAAGRIRVGAVDLAECDPVVWREQIGWVPQRPALVAGTVADNVALGVPDATDAEVADALAAAAADELDPALLLGEDGAGISAGQRQRVALARALLRSARGAGLLLLDEPTEHLDLATEERIVDTLRRIAHDPLRPRCVLVVVHREAVTRAADRVVRLSLPAQVAAESSAVEVSA